MPFNVSNPRSIVALDNASIHYADGAVQLLSNAEALLHRRREKILTVGAKLKWKM